MTQITEISAPGSTFTFVQLMTAPSHVNASWRKRPFLQRSNEGRFQEVRPPAQRRPLFVEKHRREEAVMADVNQILLQSDGCQRCMVAVARQSRQSADVVSIAMGASCHASMTPLTIASITEYRNLRVFPSRLIWVADICETDRQPHCDRNGRVSAEYSFFLLDIDMLPVARRRHIFECAADMLQILRCPKVEYESIRGSISARVLAYCAEVVLPLL